VKNLPISGVITVQDKAIFFCITGGTLIYNEAVPELRRERRINVGETSLSFLALKIFINPPNQPTS
jgi:hypothetical protein